VLTNNIGRVKLEHRYRIEQRFTSNAGYRNRFRYRINAIVPSITKRSKAKHGTPVYSMKCLLPMKGLILNRTVSFWLGYQFNNKLTVLAGMY
jgi:hypothetical protein